MTYQTNFISDEHLPPNPGLKVIRKNDPDFGLTEDEIQDRYEFIRCYLLAEFRTLMIIPQPNYQEDFFMPDVDVTRQAYSAFNSHDFQHQGRRFNKYRYAIRKIMERVQDLAVMHSSIRDPVNRAEVKQRYENFLDVQFRNPLAVLIVQYQNQRSCNQRYRLKQKIFELNRRILEAKKIWAQFAPPDVWEYKCETLSGFLNGSRGQFALSRWGQIVSGGISNEHD